MTLADKGELDSAHVLRVVPGSTAGRWDYQAVCSCRWRGRRRLEYVTAAEDRGAHRLEVGTLS
jgi:hypothetical protein